VRTQYAEQALEGFPDLHKAALVQQSDSGQDRNEAKLDVERLSIALFDSLLEHGMHSGVPEGSGRDAVGGRKGPRKGRLRSVSGAFCDACHNGRDVCARSSAARARRKRRTVCAVVSPVIA